MNWRDDGTSGLCRALARPEEIPAIPPRAWEDILAAARETSLLGALWVCASDAGVLTAIPEQARRHLEGGYRIALRNGEAIRWELEQLQSGLLTRLPPPVVLKGAAYLLADLPNARGRVCNDIDLLFPRSEVERAETLLFFEGWSTTHHEAYDQRYYREWMHELPPLEHRRRGTTLDLHHNILPETFVVRTDPERLLGGAGVLPAPWRYRVLRPPHLVLHAIVHLFAETDWDRGLRDLYDIHVLLKHYASVDGETFWTELVEEAEALAVGWLAGHAVYCARGCFATPVPAWVLRNLAGDRRGRLARPLARAAFLRGLQTRATATPVQAALGRGALFLRGHYLKMPPGLLVRHLFYKAFLAPREDEADAGNRDEIRGN